MLKEQLLWLLCLYSKWTFTMVIVWNKMEWRTSREISLPPSHFLTPKGRKGNNEKDLSLILSHPLLLSPSPSPPSLLSSIHLFNKYFWGPSVWGPWAALLTPSSRSQGIMVPIYRCHSSFWWQLPICPSEQRENGWHLDWASIQRAERAQFKS